MLFHKLLMVLKKNFKINNETITERFRRVIIIKFLSYVSSRFFMY